MANLSLREAVKHFDVSRPTLQKALKSGKISGGQDGQGHWTIDTSELARLYRPRQKDTQQVVNPLPATLPTENNLLTGEVDALRAKLKEVEQRAAVAEALAEERGKHLDDLRRLLPAPDQQPRHQWWPWRKKGPA